MGDRTQVYAIVRYDPELDDLDAAFTVKEIVLTLKEAEFEVERLNSLNKSKGVRYAFQATRMLARMQDLS
jgi:hypothetical protein